VLVYWHGSDSEKGPLTFDDGPILLIPRDLGSQRNNVPATFFYLGKNVENDPNIAKEVANPVMYWQSYYTHKNLIFDLNPFVRANTKAQSTILENTGITPFLFRPPMEEMIPLQLINQRS